MSKKGVTKTTKSYHLLIFELAKEFEGDVCSTEIEHELSLRTTVEYVKDLPPRLTGYLQEKGFLEKIKGCNYDGNRDSIQLEPTEIVNRINEEGRNYAEKLREEGVQIPALLKATRESLLRKDGEISYPVPEEPSQEEILSIADFRFRPRPDQTYLEKSFTEKIARIPDELVKNLMLEAAQSVFLASQEVEHDFFDMDFGDAMVKASHDALKRKLEGFNQIGGEAGIEAFESYLARKSGEIRMWASEDGLNWLFEEDDRSRIGRIMSELDLDLCTSRHLLSVLKRYRKIRDWEEGNDPNERLLVKDLPALSEEMRKRSEGAKNIHHFIDSL